MEKRFLLTELDSEGSSLSGSRPTSLRNQEKFVSDFQEQGKDPNRINSGAHQSEFSHESVYSEGRFPETFERGEDFDDVTTNDGSRKRYESLCEDVLEEEEEEDEDRGDDDGGWGVSNNGSEYDDDDDSQMREFRDSDYDTDLEMNDDKWLHPDKYDHDTSGLAKYLKACKDLGLEPVKYFIKHMQDEHLKFRYHGLGPEAMKALAAPLETNTTIEHLDLEGNWIMAEGTLHLCKVLKENVFLTELNLSENKIEDEGATAVCILLIENRTIEKLDLAGNGIGDRSGEIFHELLTQKNSVLRHLNLRHNKLEDGAAAYFKDALVENETLEHLDLSWNHFQCKGCVMLAEGLKENVGLKELAVSMNGFGKEGGLELGQAIYANRTLLRLDVSYCRLPDQCVSFLTHGLEHNDALQYLDVSYNALTAEGAHAIVVGIEKNDSSAMSLVNFGNTRVHNTTDDLCEKLKSERNLEVLHGGVLEELKKDLSEVDPMEAFKKDPMTKLKEWVAKAGYRLIDLLRHFDRDQSMTISIDEFRQGIQSASIEITEEQLQILVARLDQDGDGEIDFSELMEGDREHRKTRRDIEKMRQEKAQMEREKEEEEEREKERIASMMQQITVGKEKKEVDGSNPKYCDEVINFDNIDDDDEDDDDSDDD